MAWRGRGRAWAFALLVPTLLLVIAAPLAAWASGEGWASLHWSAFGSSKEFALLPVVVWWVVNLVFYGVGEELGWRGFLQPRLEERHSVLRAAGLVSLPWAVWHLPLSGTPPAIARCPSSGSWGSP